MSVIAFNFTKMVGERTGPIMPNLKVTAEITIRDVVDSSLGTQKALMFKFTHITQYQPGTGLIHLEGEVLFLSNEKELKETIESFKKTKTFAPDLTRDVYNTILTRVSVQSLILARDLNLPAPFRLPMVESAPNMAVPTSAPAPVKAAEKHSEKPAAKETKKK